ncbi:MAG: hypothetical protein K9J82_13785 [Methylotenera sp.]|jgi:hypothetical protein|nr:hypothetical protein [Methylotenera sp.]
MSRATWSGWVRQLWSGLYVGLRETGVFLAMQNGFAASLPHDVAVRSQSTSGV